MTSRFFRNAAFYGFAALVLAGAPVVGGRLSPALAQQTPAPITTRPGWVVKPTSLDFATLTARLEAAVKANKMGLVTSASASAGAKAQGIEIAGNQVFGVYRNDFARRMLAASIPAGIEAPIRFYVTEGDDRKATLSYKTPGSVFASYFEGAGPELRTLAAELDVIFARIADDATK